jgi:NTE family protein
MKLGVALGGGGAKGLAHIGVLEVFSEHGIDFEIVTGTSAGALVGASYACSSLEALRTIAGDIKLTDIPLLLSPSWSLEGLFSGRNALDRLNAALTIERIENLPKKFGATAVDLLRGELVEFTDGDVKTVLRSSFAIPGLFTPVSLDGRLLVDGGIIEVLPVSLCRRLGADKIVAVDLYGSSAPPPIQLKQKKELWPKEIQSALSFLSERIRGGKSQRMNLIKVIEATMAVIQKNSTELRLANNPAEIVIRPAVSQVGVLDFHRSEAIIEIGRIAAREALSEVKSLL